MNSYLDNFSFFPKVDHDKQKFLHVLDNLKKLNGYEVMTTKPQLSGSQPDYTTDTQSRPLFFIPEPSSPELYQTGFENESLRSPLFDRSASILRTSQTKTVCFDALPHEQNLVTFGDEQLNSERSPSLVHVDHQFRSGNPDTTQLTNCALNTDRNGVSSQDTKHFTGAAFGKFIEQQKTGITSGNHSPNTDESLKKHRRLKVHSPHPDFPLEASHEAGFSNLQIENTPSPVKSYQEISEEHAVIQNRIRSFTDYTKPHPIIQNNNPVSPLQMRRNLSANRHNRNLSVNRQDAGELRRNRAMNELRLLPQNGSQSERSRSYDSTVNKLDYVKHLVNKSFGGINKGKFIERMSEKESMRQYNKVQGLQSKQMIRDIARRINGSKEVDITEAQSDPITDRKQSYMEMFLEGVKTKPIRHQRSSHKTPPKLKPKKFVSNYGLKAGMSPGKLQEYSQKVNKLELKQTFGPLDPHNKARKRSPSEKPAPRSEKSPHSQDQDVTMLKTPKFQENENMFTYPKPPQKKKTRGEVEEAVNKEVRRKYNRLVDSSPLRQFRGSKFRKPSLHIHHPSGVRERAR